MSARRELLLLVSSMSALGRSVRVGRTVARILRAGGWSVRAHLTSRGDGPTAIARACGRGEFVAALGGDGYLTAVARGCADSGALFIPLPGGRGNDLCRALGVGADPLARARHLARLGMASDEALAARVRPLDGMWVTSDGQKRLALGIVSFGLDARANILANASVLTNGPLAYAYGALAALATHTPTRVDARIDGRDADMSGWIASVSNSGRFGGGITLVPSSDMSDGLLEVCHVGPLPMWKALRVLSGVLAGRTAAHPAIEISRARLVHFDAPRGMVAMADGDQIGTIPLTVEAAPRVVDVLA